MDIKKFIIIFCLLFLHTYVCSIAALECTSECDNNEDDNNNDNEDGNGNQLEMSDNNVQESDEFISHDKIFDYYYKYKELFKFKYNTTVDWTTEPMKSIIVVPSKCPTGYRPDANGKCRKPL